jgi:hypothetical protein
MPNEPKPNETMWCPECHGEGTVKHCVNPDNGFLDTHIHMLRYEEFRCTNCNGTGRAPKPAETK